jgi:hypothetical protein
MVHRKFQSSGAARSVLYHPNSVFRSGQKCLSGSQGKTRAEVRVKYFFSIKISTRMLISLWKSTIRAPLTSHSSTLLCSLHYLCATLFLWRASSVKKLRHQENIFCGKISSYGIEDQTLCFPKPLILNRSRRISFSTTSAASPDAP